MAISGVTADAKLPVAGLPAIVGVPAAGDTTVARIHAFAGFPADVGILNVPGVLLLADKYLI